MLSLLPWQIKPDSEDSAHARKVSEKLLCLGEYKDYCYCIGRLLQHFPSRQPEKDAIIISDLAGDCIEEGVSLCALMHICNIVRKESSLERPFLPPSGEILKRSVEKMKCWRRCLEEILNPQRIPRNHLAQLEQIPQVPWAYKNWENFSVEDKENLCLHLKKMSKEKRREYKKYLMNTCNVPDYFFST